MKFPKIKSLIKTKFSSTLKFRKINPLPKRKLKKTPNMTPMIPPISTISLTTILFSTNSLSKNPNSKISSSKSTPKSETTDIYSSTNKAPYPAKNLMSVISPSQFAPISPSLILIDSYSNNSKSQIDNLMS